jgi:hypothetical protein
MTWKQNITAPAASVAKIYRTSSLAQCEAVSEKICATRAEARLRRKLSIAWSGASYSECERNRMGNDWSGAFSPNVRGDRARANPRKRAVRTEPTRAPIYRNSVSLDRWTDAQIEQWEREVIEDQREIDAQMGGEQ